MSISRRQFQRIALASAAAPLGAASPSAAPQQSARREPPSEPRLLYNNDGSFLFYCTPPMTAEQFVDEVVGRMVGTQVDTIIAHMYGFGDAVPLYPTKVPNAEGPRFDSYSYVSEWRQQQNLWHLWDQGIDPWALCIDAAHKAGKQYWCGMRFNDLHASRFEWHSKFRRQHPEYLLGDHCQSGLHGPPPRYTRVFPCTGYNFAIPEVRAFRLELVKEVCARYDLDGFEWDFEREPGHHFPDIQQGRVILNDYMRETRAALRRIGEQRGRKVGFAVRVPVGLDKCAAIALDVKTWIEEGLVDYVAPTIHYDTATDLPFRDMVNLARGTDCRIYACPSEQRGPGWRRTPSPAVLRAGALNAWNDGVDGIYIFNFHHHTNENVDATEVLHQLGSPATLENKDKVYVVAPPQDAAKNKGYARIFQANEYPLPARLTGKPRGVPFPVSLRVSDDCQDASEKGIIDGITLQISFAGLTPQDRLQLTLNGKDLGAPSTFGLSESSVGFPGNAAYHGNYTLGYHLNPPTKWIHQGVNQLEVTLHERNPQLTAELALLEVDLNIRYRVLPMRI